MDRGPNITESEILENIPEEESYKPTDVEELPALQDMYAYSHKQYDASSTRGKISIPAEKDSEPLAEEPDQTERSDTAPPKDDLLFCGVVRGENHKALKGVAVMVAACYKNGTEEPLEFTFTDEEGNYTVVIPNLDHYSKLEGFKVRACGTSLTAETNYSHRKKTEEKPHPASPGRNYQSLLKLIYNNPNKSIYELMKNFY